MRYKKVVYDGYILGVGETAGEGNIDEAEYNRLSEVISAMPTAPDGYYYALRNQDEEWELIQFTDPQSDEASADEIAAAIEEALV